MLENGSRGTEGMGFLCISLLTGRVWPKRHSSEELARPQSGEHSTLRTRTDPPSGKWCDPLNTKSAPATEVRVQDADVCEGQPWFPCGKANGQLLRPHLFGPGSSTLHSQQPSSITSSEWASQLWPLLLSFLWSHLSLALASGSKPRGSSVALHHGYFGVQFHTFLHYLHAYTFSIYSPS